MVAQIPKIITVLKKPGEVLKLVKISEDNYIVNHIRYLTGGDVDSESFTFSTEEEAGKKYGEISESFSGI